MSYKNVVTVSLISIAYLGLAAILIGFKTDQLFIVGIFNLMYYISKPTRQLIIALSVFIVFWIIFDFMKALPNYKVSTIHIADVYNLDKSIFGINENGQTLTVNEFLFQHQSKVLDFLSGLFYLCWMPVPIGFGIYLFYTNRRKAYFDFSLTFLLTNFIGFVVYYTLPAAPPWYVALHGFNFNPHTPGNTAGLARFDQIFDIHLFQGMYAKSSNVFAAMPSLHASYPTVTFLYAVKNKIKYGSIFCGIVMIGIWFAALYTSHHYVVDVLAGISCALCGYFLYQYWDKNWKAFQRFLQKLVGLVTN
ncbi:phosphatase PAP2 family protein [Rhizosphaericola mali]|uniref:Inositol phosphorylceramide synthase n=1 Tax=Rhizosphaericola mali TaxID=2545455 RepID=A0A5P2G2W5_9BACT|nr:phosphatase PAP2 family protein [Rhizosphaericola mali]QES87453.1 inositol phosphorylceramide synthase [Rhizosphaericola mali]